MYLSERSLISIITFDLDLCADASWRVAYTETSVGNISLRADRGVSIMDITWLTDGLHGGVKDVCDTWTTEIDNDMSIRLLQDCCINGL